MITAISAGAWLSTTAPPVPANPRDVGIAETIAGSPMLPAPTFKNVLWTYVPDAAFMGILICINGKVIQRYSNSDFRLTIYSRLGELKRSILSKNAEISKSRGLLCKDNLYHNLNIGNWINGEYPKYRILDTYYGIPPFSTKFPQLNNNNNLYDDNTCLSDIYFEYQTLACKALSEEPELLNQHGDNAYKHLENVLKLKKLRFNGPTGPDDPGYYDTAYVNYQNPVIPEGMTAYRYNDYSTDDSLSWLVFDICQRY
jgi:hypothetical protein